MDPGELVLYNIFKFSDRKDIVSNFTRVSDIWNKISSSNELWIYFIKRDFYYKLTFNDDNKLEIINKYHWKFVYHNLLFSKYRFRRAVGLHYDLHFRVTIIGDPKVGKTNL